MANCRRLLLPLLLVLSAVFASAQLPVNVDCGTTGKNKGYLGLTWVGDEQYVPSGQSTTVKIDDSLIAPLTTLRYFPSGKKNCYSFPGVGQGIKILVRAWFYYGNYDGLSSPPTFNVLFNGNLWSPVFMTGDNGSAILEMIHATKVDDVSVCLARTNAKDVPFINALEIRKLEADMYYSMDSDRPLHAMGRYAYASPSTNVVRYPDDPYDRLWFIFSNYASGLSPLSRSSDPLSNLADRPPAAVLRQAITPSSSLASNMTIPNLITSTSPVPHYVTFYFVEMSSNATRSFDFFLDNERFYSKTIVTNGTVLEIFHPKVNLSTSSVFSLVRANGSALPPLISAAEFFKVGDIWAVAATDSSDVTALSALQKSYVQLQQWSGDPCLPVGYAWEWLNCSSDSTPRVTSLYLSGYGLSGPLADFSNLTALQTIDLHNNSLSGSIPEFLGKLPNLQQLNLADNQFNGSVPSSLTGNSKVNLNISGNNISSGTISSSPSNSTIKTKKKTNGGVVAGAIIGSLLFLLLLVLFVIFIFKGRRTPVQLNAAADNAKPTALLEPEIKHEFSHAEIVEITNNFETVIGEGGSGNVYYGRLKNGREVAVKVLKDSLEQGIKEFVAEVKLLMTVHHKCLVSFIGYCEEDGKLILLYEYMSGGNLRQLLSGRDSTSAFLTWQTRLQMALNVAAGLDYLHSGCYPQIIHRDVKTTNILLNAKMEAKVADFGLSKAGHKDDVTQLTTVVAGTPGYIDPEYYRTNLVTKKSDVYSFGVVLFELMTGYAPLFNNVSGERFHIVEWATSRLTRGNIHSVADPRLGGQYEVNSMWKVADIAMSCTAPSSEMRPHMSDVVIQLKEAIEAESYSQQRTGNSSAEVQHSSSSYGFSSSHVSNSSLPPAR